MTATTERKVGPNAILQTAEALMALGGGELAQRVFGLAGLAAMLDNPPAEMVSQDDAASLHRAIADALPGAEAALVAADAGRRTGRYILQNRIPRPARIFLKMLPARLSGPLLLKAIERHAWTFAGSGRVSHQTGRPLRFSIAGNPLAMPGCTWHCAVFETLFRELVHPRTQVREESCCASGDRACVFVIDYQAGASFRLRRPRAAPP